MTVQAIQCNKCKQIIYSRAVHDFHWCKCKSCAIDGGFSYTKITGNPSDWTIKHIEVLTEVNDDKAKKILYDDWNYRKNKYGYL